MNTALRLFLGSSLLFVAGSAAAQGSGLLFNGRIGPTVGMYELDVSKARLVDPTTGLLIIDPATGQPLFDASQEGDQELAYGAQVGLTAGWGSFSADVAIDYLRLDLPEAIDRTDLLLTLGYLIGSHGSVFAGYRFGFQGDGFFNDDIFKETGPFIGAGIGGIEVGAVTLSSSLAWNFSQIEDFPVDGQETDYDGISLKLGGALKSHPQHVVQLRYQMFEGDDSSRLDVNDDGVADAILELDVEESYLQLFYLYNFAL